MLKTDLPAESWQCERFDDALYRIGATHPIMAEFIQIIVANEQNIPMLIQVSENLLRESIGEGHALPPQQTEALVVAFRQFYAAVDGHALVAQANPALVQEIEAPPRGPGRPRTTPDARLEPAPIVTGTVSPWAPEPARINGSDVMDRLMQDMMAYTQKVQSSFFENVQPDDVRVRLWTVQELSVLLGVPSQQLLNWRRLGYGPKFIQTGQRSDSVRYPVFRVIEWLTEASEPAEGTQIDLEL